MVEVLVTMAIIATLSSLLFSSLKTSKDLSKKAVCLSNLSQIRTVTELYRKSNGSLPYSEIWLTDFSYAGAYLSGTSLRIFTCPGSDDAFLTDSSQLNGSTSYHYVPTFRQLEKHLEDGLDMGVSGENLALLQQLKDGIIYDKSATHHNGSINIAYLFTEEDPDGNGGTVTTLDDPTDLPEITATGHIDLPELDPDTPLDPETPAEPETPEEPEEPESPFEPTDDGTIILTTDATIKYEVVGAAISYGGQYDMAVTAQFIFDSADENGGTNTQTVDPFGIYSDPIGSNLNTGDGANPVSYDLSEVYPAGTEVTIRAKSWKKKKSRYSGDSINHWKQYMEVISTIVDGNASSLHNVMILTNGQSVPQVDGFMDQDNILTFLDAYVTNGTVNIGDNQALILFELGTTNLSSSAADFQDLVVLMTFFPAEEEEDDSQGNNGHGNNVDGVDTSNPGNAPFTDSDPDVDDEK